MRHTASRFTYNKDRKELVAEISDLGDNAFGQIYPDACDYGLILISHVTGRETKWVVTEERRNADNELQYWALIPTAETLRREPATRGHTIVVLND